MATTSPQAVVLSLTSGPAACPLGAHRWWRDKGWWKEEGQNARMCGRRWTVVSKAPFPLPRMPRGFMGRPDEQMKGGVNHATNPGDVSWCLLRSEVVSYLEPGQRRDSGQEPAL